MKHPERLALLAFIASLTFPAAASASPATAANAGDGAGSAANSYTAAKDSRPGSLDMVLLLDKSLSMAPFYGEVKEYAAGKVLGPILIPGDRLVVELVYGKVQRLLSVAIGSEEDKAKAIRAIRAVKPDGHFTDLGAALDAAKRDLEELGQPDRMKYVLLVTDEIQEAPKGSPYQAADYKLKHPSLEYVKRVDLGKFRAITVGLGVGAEVDKAAPTVMELLMDPPIREGVGPATALGAQVPVSGPAAGAATPAERALPSWLLYCAAALLVLALAAFAVVLVLSRKRDSEETAVSK